MPLDTPGTGPTPNVLPPLNGPGSPVSSSAVDAWTARVNAEVLAGVTIDQAKAFISAHLDTYLTWKAASVSGRFQVVPPG